MKKIKNKNTTINCDSVYLSKLNIDLIASSYVHAKRRLYESEYSNYEYPGYILMDDERIVSHINAIISSLEEDSKFILENEIVLNKKGAWYREYCSSTTYYRMREKAYKDFMEEIDK